MGLLSHYNIPQTIEGYELRSFQTIDFVKCIYSTDGSFIIPNAFSKDALNSDLFKEYFERYKSCVKHDIAAPADIIEEKIKEKLFLNEHINTIFENRIALFGYDTTTVVENNGFYFVSKLFELYAIIESNSNALFYVVVSIFPLIDTPFIIDCLNNLSKNHIEKGLEISFESADCNSKEIFISKKVHFVSFSADADIKIIRDTFLKSGWRVNLINEKSFIEKQNQLEKQLQTIILCEGTDKILLNSLNIPNVIFSDEHNSYTIFQNAKTNKRKCLRDKDYLTYEEIKKLKIKFPLYYILDLYCLENYLYYPDNIKEYVGPDFNIEEYKSFLLNEKDKSLSKILPKIIKSRANYAELKENHINPTIDGAKQVYNELCSTNFDVFYKHLDMKKINKSYLSKYKLTKMKLASTRFFRECIKYIIK